jgi:hypothetical protein
MNWVLLSDGFPGPMLHRHQQKCHLYSRLFVRPFGGTKPDSPFACDTAGVRPWPGAGIALTFYKTLAMSTTTATMTTTEIANRLAELCKQGQFEAAQKELFADDAISIEPYGTPAFDKETKGLDAIIQKGHKWSEMVTEYHGMKVSEPLVAGDCFALTMWMSVTMKDSGKMDMTELCLYKVKDGKIVSEEFLM